MTMIATTLSNIIAGTLKPNQKPRAIGHILLLPPKTKPTANERIATMLMRRIFGLDLTAENRTGANNTHGTTIDIKILTSSRYNDEK